VRARIARTIVGVAALVLVVLGIPFAILVQQFYESRATVELQRSAAEAIAELELPLDADEIANAAREPDVPAEFSVYDETGVRLYGSGPDRLDTAEPGKLVVVSPITDHSNETLVGSVRVSRPESEIAGDTRRAWALMALAGVGGLVLAMFVAVREAKRLASPISELAARAGRLGSGEFDVSVVSTGTPELDTVAEALAISGRRLAELVGREREFSANASHQLRTPLAGLRVSLERGDLAAASEQVDRLSSTVDHMLALARNALPTPDVADIGPIIADAAQRWVPVYLAAERKLVVTIGVGLPGARVRPHSIEQAVDVLLDNALRHGDGDTRITARSAPGGLVVQIDDDGPGVDVDRSTSIFDRHEGDGDGIGLALARTLVEADDGRLMLSNPDHAEFRIVLAAAVPTSSEHGEQEV
jgi:signal transduction histidine kinase